MIDEKTLSFLESALDRDFYVVKKPFHNPKPPLRVLITEAGERVAHHLIYKICTGMVFGQDQEIILHLASSKGSLHHRDFAIEMFECGFSCYKDFVVSANPHVLYKDIDYAVLVTTYEEVPGWGVKTAFSYQVAKCRQLAQNVEEFAKPNCKIILTGPSTKAVVSFLSTFRRFARKTPESNITSVTCLDVNISKALLAAKLQTTTDKIKNIIIWSCTFPDVTLGTVRMKPQGDLRSTKTVTVPIAEAIGDEFWMNQNFKKKVFKRVMSRDLLKWGKSIASATAHHLKVLHLGTDEFDEIQSMGVITPSKRAYHLPPGKGFSYPVIVANGKVEIMQNIPVDITTIFNRLRILYSIAHSYMYNSEIKIILFLIDYESAKKQTIDFDSASGSPEGWEEKTYFNKYFITPNPAEKISHAAKLGEHTRKIAWPKSKMKKENAPRRSIFVENEKESVK